MHWVIRALGAITALVLCLASAHAAATVHGVRVEDTATVEGVNLQLNGFGTRYKGPFKVYVGELYTTKKVGSLEELISAPGPKRLSMVFVREIEAGPFGKLLTRGVEDNAPLSERSRLVPGLIRMGEMFAAHRQLKAGDTFQIDWIPGQGTVITVKGQPQGEPYKEPEFFNALLRIWLGPNPADWKLKDALLGKAPA